ncbi:hypothetical protein POJ06DRAFT_270821 [Lipomyces tetrasporus]|uniref:Autophagy-related protein 2 n=1 Tax=Lipomyces tetrasporus TaxID=54092 RepID=A0AAD7QMN6_9ASCO|nr:uncharacterized protein POJ06DRAFT_270821 [Lipomyces tetrasporus]KAJ8098008.1 hypothetical protein POJ06DRAFT_270821 [Lipomyces tetrasporus]
MRPPWLPQNIQKRLLRYILSRVAIFDDLDLANLDVQLGTSSSISLRDVRLNVDAISIPGMFLRDGQVGEITVRVPRNILTTPIEVSLSGVDVSVAPSPSGPSAEDFMSRTTANLASSFLHSETAEETIELEKSIRKSSADADDSSTVVSDSGSTEAEDDELLLGFGTGGFNLQSMMSKAVDMLISQLRITITGLSVRVVLQNLILQGTIEGSQFVTEKDGIRVFRFTDIQFSLPPDLNQDYLPFRRRDDDRRSSSSSYSSESSTDSSTDEGGVSSSDAEEGEGAFDLSTRHRHKQPRSRSSKSLLESMYFSKEEAGSIYMSAMSPSAQGVNKSSTSSITNINGILQDLAISEHPVFHSEQSNGNDETVPSSIENRPLREIPPRLLWCDEFEISILGPLSKAEFRMGTLRTGLAHMDAVAEAIACVLEGFLNRDALDEFENPHVGSAPPAYVSGDTIYDSSSTPANESSSESSCNVKIGVRSIEISPSSDLSATGEFILADRTRLVFTNLYASLSQSYTAEALHNPYSPSVPPTIASILSIDSVHAVKSGETILAFDGGEGKSLPDVSITSTSAAAILELPNKLDIVASVEVLEEIALFANSVSAVFKSFTSASSRSTTPVPHAHTSLPKSAAEYSFTGTTNIIRVNILTSSPAITLGLTIHPLSISRNQVRSDGIVLRVPGADVSLHSLLYECSPDVRYLERNMQYDRAFEREVGTRLSLASLKVNSTSVEQLLQSMKSISGEFSRIVNVFNIAAQSSAAQHPQSRARSARLQTPVSLVTVNEADIALEFPGKVGNITLHFDAFDLASCGSGVLYIDSEYVRVVRHTPFDSDEDEDEFELVGAALEERRRDRPMVSIVLRDTKIVSAAIYNVRFEYRIDVLLLFASAFGNESKKDAELPEKIKMDLFGVERSPSPSWDYDMLGNDRLHSEVDDEDYADEDFGLEEPSIDESVATLKSAVAPYRFDLSIRDCAVGLNPLGLPSKGLLVITDGNADGYSRDLSAGLYANVKIRRATLFLIDDVQNLRQQSQPQVAGRRKVRVVEHMTPFADFGYVSVASISSSSAKVKFSREEAITGEKTGNVLVEMELRDDLLFVESCPDSTQTLIEVINGLKPPVVVTNDEMKYHTEVLPVDLLASLDESAFRSPKDGSRSTSRQSTPHSSRVQASMMDSLASNDTVHATSEVEKQLLEAVGEDLQFVESYYGSPDAAATSRSNSAGSSRRKSAASDDLDFPESVKSSSSDLLLNDELDDGLMDVPLPATTNLLSEDLEDSVMISKPQQSGSAAINQKVQDAVHKIEILEDHFGRQSLIDAALSRAKTKLIQVKVRDVHVLWNLHDGYDWPRTRDTISKAIKRVEGRALEALRNRLQGGYDSDGNESIIGDFLFNSIYIGIPSGNDPRELTNAINREIDDESETASQASSTTAYSSRPSSRVSSRPSTPIKKPKLRLKRSKAHKIQVELKGVNVDFVSYPEDSEVANCIDLRVRDFEVFDNVPTSTWRKFVTYMYSAGEREAGGSMAHIEMLNVRPSPDLATSEIVLKASVLPLRLYVDQDALDFLARFLTFKSDTASSPVSEEIPFLQRVEFTEVKVKLDYKPKKVDYAGLRSGHTTEFMNFFVLDEAKIILRGVVLYGVLGFPRLFQMLNDIWMPDIKSTQLGDVLAGVAPVRSLVKLGSGVRDLVVVPIREYKRDGRVVRSLQKGAIRFAQVTTNELVNLGAKLAVGTQNVLENAESLLVGQSSASTTNGETFRHVGDDSESEDEIPKAISMYADQPYTVVQGLQRAYSSLNRNFGTAKDILVALPTEASDQGGAQKAAIAVARAAPVAVLRSMIGATEAVSSTLMGVNNQMDPQRRRNIEDKYKRR